MHTRRSKKSRRRRYEVPTDAFEKLENALRRGERRGRSLPFRISSIAAATGCLILAFFLISAVGAGPFVLQGYGNGIEDLQEGARVVLGAQEVGTVTKITVIKGRIRATLKLQAELQGNLGRLTGFGSGSVNRFLPGDLGVIIDPAEPRDATDILLHGDEVEIRTDLFAHIPSRFWVTALLSLAAIAGTVATYRFFRSILTVFTGVSVFVSLIAYLYQLVGVA